LFWKVEQARKEEEEQVDFLSCTGLSRVQSEEALKDKVSRLPGWPAGTGLHAVPACARMLGRNSRVLLPSAAGAWYIVVLHALLVWR